MLLQISRLMFTWLFNNKQVSNSQHHLSLILASYPDISCCINVLTAKIKQLYWSKHLSRTLLQNSLSAAAFSSLILVFCVHLNTHPCAQNKQRCKTKQPIYSSFPPAESQSTNLLVMPYPSSFFSLPYFYTLTKLSFLFILCHRCLSQGIRWKHNKKKRLPILQLMCSQCSEEKIALLGQINFSN